MLIYGNTPRDIKRMIWRRRHKFITVFAVLIMVLVLASCGTAEKKKFELKALDKFWDTLGGKTTDLVKPTK